MHEKVDELLEVVLGHLVTNVGFNAIENNVKRLGLLNLFRHEIYILDDIVILLFLFHHL
jgi:hypothetical protein